MSINQSSATSAIRVAIGIFGLGSACIASTMAQAATVAYDNLDLSRSNGVDSINPVIGIGPAADSFTASAGNRLTDIKLDLSRANLGSTGSFTVSLLSDNAFTPGSTVATLGTFNDSTLDGTLRTYDFSNFSPVNLTIGSRYWIQVAGSANSSASWSWSSNLSGTTGVVGERYANKLGEYPNSGGPYQMQVTTATYNSLFDNSALAKSSGVDSINPVNGLGPIADSFFSPKAERLSDVKLALSRANLGSTGSLTVSLFSDSSFKSGSFLANLGTISDSLLDNTLKLVDLSGFGIIDLAADTRYWIKVAASSGSSANWSWSTDISGTGVAGERYSNKLGEYPNSGGPYQMLVSAVDIPSGPTSVPEPGSIALLMAGIAAYGFGRHRMARS
ncbi:MAG: PEP-CTERM sorting domain-containing protein [Methylovulum sp.]|uniref:choice-of-anchor R domain-containing protein n=1 Tax=Methylovulum sp. TaxID=1916980 RepID=UPI00262638E9|nr:choice-of-anchor R domain-containing protein [Methylovulum sp.]MDD2724874.1 PEP-CTERM sorting domain-containing protein [Methylovulum sp.]